jgi:hypothetical protein
MSNFLAVATVSAALQRLLTPSVSAAVPGAEVWVDRSDVNRTKSGVNIYLYRSSIDAIRRNEELPARRDDGTLRVRPKVAASLHYLLTFHGKDDELVPQRLMGATLATLHTRPIMSRTLIDAVNDEAADPNGMHKYLALNDLLDADELVRVSPDPMSLDDLSKLWSVFFQSAYQLSATYIASAVLLEETLETPIPSPPVTQPQLSVRALQKPTILSARNLADARAPVLSDSVLSIEGSGLRGDRTLVRIGPSEVTPGDADTRATSVQVQMATATGLRAGWQPVIVAHEWLVGDPALPRGGETSNAVGLFVAPKIALNVTATQIGLTSDLSIGRRQQVSVSLLNRTTGTTARSIDVADRDADTNSVSVPRPAASAELPAGQYGVTLNVDGAQSPVNRNASGTITSPLVTVS